MTNYEIEKIDEFADYMDYSVTIADLDQAHRPLIYVNNAFCEMTGYSKEEVLGKNCRFLQGSDTEPEDVDKVREAIKNRESVFIDLINYKKDGSWFYNRLCLFPFHSDGRSLYMGLQIDSTNLVNNDIIDFSQSKKFRNIQNDILPQLQRIQEIIDAENSEEFNIPNISEPVSNIHSFIIAQAI
ncbi:MAG: PAS domain-containing protein [Bdellovibrionales bacterium]